MNARKESFESRLTGGHPNSLGNTVEVVEAVLADKSQLQELYECYFSDDEIVRLRTSSAIKRVSKDKPEWLLPYIDSFLSEIAKIDQASTQWTLAQLFLTLGPRMSNQQKTAAKKVLKRNLKNHSDWIVLNTTMETLSKWSIDDSQLRKWLLPHLARLQKDGRKSVAGQAAKWHKSLVD